MANPIKPSFRTEWFPLVLIVLAFITGGILYSRLPAAVPTHWNVYGQVDGYSGPFVAAFMIPIMIAVMYLFFMFIPYLDPKKEQYAAFAKVYHLFKDLISAFLFILYLIVMAAGLGYRVNVGFWVPVMIGALFIILGFLLERVKMNWFLGIRTPWTMSSEAVWQKTHKLSSRILAVSGLLLAATVLVPPTFKVILFCVAIAMIVLGLPVYSYIIYRRQPKKDK